MFCGAGKEDMGLLVLSAVPPREEGALEEIGSVKRESAEGVEVGVGEGESAQEVKERRVEGWHPLVEAFLEVG